MKENIDKNGKKRNNDRGFWQVWSIKVHRMIRFVTNDMWRLTDEDVSGPRWVTINAMKSVFLSVRYFDQNDLATKASALTYRTVISIVPMLAVLIGIAKGFGLQQYVRDWLKEYLPSHQAEFDQAFGYVENYLMQVQGGLFVGVGLIVLLYTVFALIADVEDTFVSIWQTQKRRPWKRRIIDYTGAFFLMPVFMIASSGLTLMMTTVQGTYFSEYIFFGPILSLILNLVPYVTIVLLFTGMYMALPTVRVHFLPAFIAGTLSGIVFQIFQALYMSGILWISKYNAIYGSFAVVPLLLLWIQLSWTIILFGAQLSFSIQNVRKFAFEKDTSKVSRRYMDFITIVVASLIVKRFVSDERKPRTIDSLAMESKAPIRLVADAVHRLQSVGVVMEVNYAPDTKIEYFSPAMDPDKLTVGLVLDKIDRCGSESFKVDRAAQFFSQWKLTEATRSGHFLPPADTLLRDL
ncbi:YihY/virulence factor BrkB family protein [Porphyromonas loveana]|uniref:YihY/virulence factor BrkB family protein n=1 Tax=Porphyromonas loveana TaxID=1884669 RepID=UPI0035A0D93E